ncbi:hypothetical protein BGZ94_002241 [Podila epigama]|nr:hypothetical protein BGZ94_002241 [Podila epigama]
MGGFWTRSTSSSASTDASAESPSPSHSHSQQTAHPSPLDQTAAVSVQPAPAPAKALTAPLPSRWFSLSSASAADRIADPTANTKQIETASESHPHSTSSPSKNHTEPSRTIKPSPKQEHSALPPLPFIPSPDHNPDLTGFTRFKADPSSILLQYPRSNVDHIHDFYSIYNPSEKGLWAASSKFVMRGVAAVSKTFLTFGAYTGVYNMNSFLKILYDPHRTRPILTVTNHASTADDPLLWGALPWKCYTTPTRTIRYALGAQELCYPNKPVGAFFRFGQIVPIIRGNGIYQPAIDKSINLLRSGRWVHIFPEGKINQTPELIRLKWGVGRILMEYGGPPIREGGQPMSEIEMPIVIPIYHLGMEDILRLNDDNSSPVFPKLGMPLAIIFGEPVEFESVMQDYKDGKCTEIEARVKMTERVFDALEELKLVAMRLQKELADKAEADRIQKGFWWWVQPTGWGWWRSPDIPLSSKYRDTAVKIEDL